MTRILLSLPLLAFLWISGVASAEAQGLRPRTLVEGELIRLGDLFSALPDELAQRAVAPAPAPGRTTLFDAAALTQIARETGLSWKPQTRFDRVLVERASRPIAAEDIEARLFAALKADGLPDGMRVELTNRRLALDAAIGSGPAFEIQSLNYDKREGIVTATLAVASGMDSSTPVDVRGVVFRTARVPVLSRPFRHGQVIRSDDIAFKDQRAGSLDPNLVLDVDAIVGKTPRTSVRAGEPLRRTALMAPVVVAKGELVTMMLHTPQMTLTAQGRATESGADGQTIRVENTRSRTAIEATVIGPNRVSVHVPSLAALVK